MPETVKDHILRVKDFMQKANQETPEILTEPSEEVRILRAKLILEEALETIQKGLGVKVETTVDLVTNVNYVDGNPYELYQTIEDDLNFSIDKPYDVVETLDGLIDGSVVGLAGTAIACGMSAETVERALKEVDDNNLAKFGPGHSIREDGKLIKPADHTPPDIAGILEKQDNG